jgi:hypothetical protein
MFGKKMLRKKMTQIHSYILVFAITSVTSETAFGLDYGIFDARGLGMAGTVVALASPAQAQFYNPALLTFKTEKEVETNKYRRNLPTNDGHFYFPTLVVQASDTVNSVIDALNNNLDTKLTNSINSFNRQQIASSAAIVSDSATDLKEVLDKIVNKDLTINSFVGLAGGDSSGPEGSALYIGMEVIGVGTSVVTDSDLALLDEYIVATDALAAGASPLVVAVQHPQLINPNGTLIDPTKLLTSTADIGGLVILEGGMSVAREITLYGQTISLGLTPKIMQVNAYRKKINFNSSNLANLNASIDQFSDTKSTHITFNADLGFAIAFAQHYRVGLAVRDIFAKNFTAKQIPDPITHLKGPELDISLGPRPRLGFGYENKRFNIGLDYDLKKSKPLTNETPNQDMSIGAEYHLFKAIALRAGWRQDLTGVRENAVSVGVGFLLDRFLIEFAYSQSRDVTGGGFQMGWTF